MSARRATRLALAFALACSVLLAGCGSDSDNESPAVAGATTAAETTTPAATTATVPSAPAPSAPRGAVTFRDPGGAYEIDVDPDWTDQVAQPKAWLIGSRSDAFSDNVNVIVQTLPADMGLDEYLDVSVRNAPNVLPGVEVVSRDVVTLTSGEAGGRLELRFTNLGRKLASLGVIGVTPGRAVVATLTAERDRFGEAVAAVEPYLRTLRLP